MVSTRRGDSRAPGISGNESVSWQSLGLPNLQCPHLPLIDCTFLRSACCASDKLTDLLAKGQSFKRRDLSTLQYIHSKAALSVEQITFSEERLFSVPFWGMGHPLARAVFLTSPTEGRSRAYVKNFSRINLARGDPADHDGRADHVGRALLTSGAFGYIESIEEKR